MPEGTAAPQLRILLVEEQAVTRDLVRPVLGRLHHRVESVADGGSALAQAQRDPADLVLVSTTLPDMPGAALIGALRDLPRLERAPIVAVCHGGAAVREACLAAGAAACLDRPVEIERLLRLIERLFPSRPGPEPGIEEPVLDLDHLRHFTEGDPQLESELSALFLSTSEVYLQDMRQALQERRAWRSSAHALKGASANLGARRVAALALIAERSEPSPGQLEAIEVAIAELRTLLERSRPASEHGPDRGENEEAAREIP
jgi:CheY-like chemotaxis protein